MTDQQQCSDFNLKENHNKDKPKDVEWLKEEKPAGKWWRGETSNSKAWKRKFDQNLVRKLSPMKKMEERRPVMFIWWEVQEKPVPNCQEAKNPMKATWIK